MGLTTFGVVSPGAVTDTWDPSSSIVGQRGEPGTIHVLKNDSGEFSLVRIIQMGNTSCTAGQVLMQNHATLKGYSRRVAATTDEGAPITGGISAAAIGSHKCGYEYIGGYVPTVDISETPASGEYLMISGSTAGQLTVNRASCFNQGSSTTDASAFVVVGVSRGAGTAGCDGSIQLTGVWG